MKTDNMILLGAVGGFFAYCFVEKKRANTEMIAFIYDLIRHNDLLLPARDFGRVLKARLKCFIGYGHVTEP
jgi:hypothetical protein